MDTTEAFLRGHTDPLSNTIVLTEFDLKEYLAATVKKRLPFRSLPQFLHEITHHWCFNSPVGLTLFLLSARARRRSLTLLGKDAEEDGLWPILEDVLRYELVDSMMRPLSEGLALFAEHDVFPGDSQIISIPSLLGAALYRQPDDKEFSLDTFSLIARDVRLRTANVRRKADLLIQPLDCTYGGYLAGYLCLKNIYFIVLQQSDLFSDNDFFLHFVRCFFYDDWGLVEALLEESAQDQLERFLATEEIAHYFQRRLVKLVMEASDSDAKAKAFESRGKAGDADVFEYRGNNIGFILHSHPVEGPQPEHRGKRLLRRLLDDLFEVVPEEELQQNAFNLDMRILSLRNSLTLGSNSFVGNVNEHRMLRVLQDDGNILFMMVAPDALATGWSGTVKVNITISVVPPGIYLFLLVDRELVFAQSLGASGVPSLFDTPLVDRDSRREILNATGAALEDVMSTEFSQKYLEILRQSLPDLLNRIYIPRAIAFTSESSFQKLRAEMETDGFLNLFGRKSFYLLDAALASLLASQRIEIGAVDHSWSGGHPQQTLEELNNILFPLYGRKTFWIDNDHILWAMI